MGPAILLQRFAEFFPQPDDVIPGLDFRSPALRAKLLELPLQIAAFHVDAGVVADTPACELLERDLAVADLGINLLRKRRVQSEARMQFTACLVKAPPDDVNAIGEIVLDVEPTCCFLWSLKVGEQFPDQIRLPVDLPLGFLELAPQQIPFVELERVRGHRQK